MPITDHVDSMRDCICWMTSSRCVMFARMSKMETVDFVRDALARRKLIAEAERYGEA